MHESKKLLILGASAIAEVAYEYFTHDSPFDVTAFCVDREFMTAGTLFGLPVVPLDEVQRRYAPGDHAFFAATNYNQSNALRKRFYDEMKAKGYRPASYVSSRAFVWGNCQIGEHCFILEDNTLQPFARVGNNVVLWSGNHVGHHSVVGDHTFVSSHVVISGFCRVGDASFLGVNATLANNVSVGAKCVIGAGALIMGDVPDGETVVGIWRGKRPQTAAATAPPGQSRP